MAELISVAPGRTGVRLRAARVADIPDLARFIAAYTGDGTLLARPRANLLHYLRDFRLVTAAGGRLIGCGALQLVSEDLAEIRSLAVDPAWRSAGLGGRLLGALLVDARRLGIARVFCLTRRTDFFARHGFAVTPLARYPDKIWNDCRLCARRDACDEVAMELVLPRSPAAAARRQRQRQR
jgi:amino-acid N-acetyltransferase